MNVITAVGRLTKDVELKHTSGSGIPYARVTLAVNDGIFKDGKEGTDWMPLLLWQKNAENTSKYVGKGSLVSIRGRYKSNNYQGQDGKTVYGHDIVVEEIRFLDKKESSTQPQQSADPSIANQQTQSQAYQQNQQPSQQGYNPTVSNAGSPDGFGFNR